MIQNIQKKIKEFCKDDSGVMIIEASYVFPITFFVIFFLIYFGNMLYIRAAIASYVSDATVQGAAYCANPWLEQIEEEKKVPKKITDIKPYRNLNVFGGNSGYEAKMQDQLKSKIAGLGGGFFYGMKPKNIECTAKYKNYIVTADFSIHVKCKITFPLNFLGEDSPWEFTIAAYEKAPVIDGCELIRNVNMGLDYIERSETAQIAIGKIQELFEKVKSQSWFQTLFG